MNTEFKQLSIDDGETIYQMLQTIPNGENGFSNGCYGKSYEDYQAWLKRQNEIAHGIGLADWMVEQTCFWLYVDGQPVGFGKLRHRLTPELAASGGLIGYAIAPAHRRKGYGKALVRLLTQEAHKMGIDKLLLTIHNDNIPSIKAALACGGVIEKVDEKRHHIWIAVDE